MRFLPTLFACLLLAIAGKPGIAQAQEQWKAEKLNAEDYPPGIVADKAVAAPNGLPDGRVFTVDSGDIRKAWYEGPTRRYKHGVLGDDIEAGELKVEDASGRKHSIRLANDEVFEDITPRIADLDNAGRNEVVTIRSSLSKGASVTIYGMSSVSLVQKASTGFIGKANRWLNIAAIAPMADWNSSQIAFVRTPHIGGDLFIAAYRKGVLLQIAAMRGFSNHVIGSNELRLSAVADIDGDGLYELVLPSQDRKSLRIVGYRKGGLHEVAKAALTGAIDKAIGVETKNADVSFIAGLEDGTVWRVTRK